MEKIIVSEAYALREIKELLENGWKVKFPPTLTDSSPSKICVVLEKEDVVNLSGRYETNEARISYSSRILGDNGVCSPGGPTAVPNGSYEGSERSRL